MRFIDRPKSRYFRKTRRSPDGGRTALVLLGLCCAGLAGTAPSGVNAQETLAVPSDSKIVCVEVPLFADPWTERLADGWSWQREDAKAWRVAKGQLQIRLQPGNLWGGANNGKNVLMRELPKLPGESVAVEVTVAHEPTGQYEQADIAWYYDDSNMVKLANEWIDGKPNVVMGREQDDRSRTIAIVPIPAPNVQLRFVVSGDQVKGQYRPDAKGPWKDAGTCDSPGKGPARISLHTYNGPANLEHWARFSGFRIYVPSSKAAEHIQSVIDALEVECLEPSNYVPIVGRAKAERLAELVRRARPRLVVECGTAWGYSGLWIARELKANGRGKLITIEIDSKSAARAKAEFAKAGVDDVVTVEVGDARKVVREIQGPIDFVLIDCNAPNYLPCLQGLQQNLADGAVVVADNAGLSAAGLKDYFQFVRSKYESRTEWFDVNLPWAKRDAMEISTVGKK